MKFNELNYEQAVMHLTNAIYWLTQAHFEARLDMSDDARAQFERCWSNIDGAVKLIQEFQDETTEN